MTFHNLHPAFLRTFMNICYKYSVKWRYEFNYVNSGIVTFGEAKRVPCQSMHDRDRVLGNDSVNELYEYKNLGVVKNCTGSFSSNVDEDIDKTRKKAGIIFSSNFDRRKVNPLIYIKFWRQACLPTLLYCTELFTLTPSLLTKSERCQQWFLKNISYVPKFAPRLLLIRFSGLNSVESETSIRKLLFLGRLLTRENMASVVRNLFQIGLRAFLI